MDLINDFGFKLLHQFPKDQNITISPTGLFEIADLLGNSQKLTGKHHGTTNKLVQSALTADSEFFTAHLSNGICFSNDNGLNNKETSVKCYTGPAGVTKANSEVKKQSKDRFPTLITSAGDGAVLFSSLFIDAPFCNICLPDSTEKAEFHVNATTVIKDVPYIKSGGMMMFNDDKEVGLKMTLLNFNGCVYQIAVIVPTKKFGLAEMEQKLTGQKLSKLLNSMRTVLGGLSLPKLSLENNVDIKQMLGNLGLTVDTLNSATNSAPIARVMHSVSVNLNEFGCNQPLREVTEQEMMSATMCCGGFIEMPEQQDVNADQPFLLAIVRNQNDAEKVVVTLSRVVKPTINTH